MEKRILEFNKRNIITVLLIVIGLIMDTGVNITGRYYVLVTESYMDYIYSAIITISILSFSFIAIISGVLDKKYYGYKLREIIQFRESPLNFRRYIVWSLGSVALATVFLAGDFVISCGNSLTMLLLAIIYLEGNIAFNIYEVMTDDKVCYDLVINHYRTLCKEKDKSFESFQANMDRMISALKICISECDHKGKNDICNMLIELENTIPMKEKQDKFFVYYDYFNSKIKECIYDFTNVFGYNEMVKDVVKLYKNLTDFEYGRIDLYIIPLQNMRFWEDNLFIKNDYFKQIIEMDFLEEYNDGLITNSEAERIFYCYFDNVLNNQICSTHVKKKVIESYIRNLTKFHWKSNTEEGMKPDCSGILNILLYFVLKNENSDERNYIFKII